MQPEYLLMQKQQSRHVSEGCTAQPDLMRGGWVAIAGYPVPEMEVKVSVSGSMRVKMMKENLQTFERTIVQVMEPTEIDTCCYYTRTLKCVCINLKV